MTINKYQKLFLKKVNIEDVEQEFLFISNLPANENGFTNSYHGVTKEEFYTRTIYHIMNHSEGKDLPAGYVPETYFFLWDYDHIVGLFRIRHYLNEFLRNGAGHIGYGIHPDYRGKGYATMGLALAIEEAKKIIPEDEIYLSVNIDNIASFRVQEKNGAYLHHSDEREHYTRISIR